MTRVDWAMGAVVATVSFLSGCNSSSGVTTVPVTGSVTYKGSPVEGAQVVFSSVSPGGRTASGTTDAQGAFTLTTYVGPTEQPKGAVAGDYTVTVSKVDSSAVAAPVDSSTEEGRKQMMTMMTSGVQKPGAKAAGPKSLLPEKYADPKKSDLKASVAAGTPNEFKFELKD